MLNDFSNESLKIMLILAPILLFSLAVHEFAHAYVAYKLGDISQKNKGRLTLDPFTHVSWLGFISLLLVGIGWGKPVEVNTQNFKKPSKGLMLSSLAGPVSNVLLAVVFALILKLIIILGGSVGAVNNFIEKNTLFQELFLPMIVQAIYLNVFLAVFNLLPLPPFDGSKILSYFLPYKYKDIMYTLEKYTLIIFMILIVTDLHLYIINPIQNFILDIIMNIIL